MKGKLLMLLAGFVTLLALGGLSLYAIDEVRFVVALSGPVVKPLSISMQEKVVFSTSKGYKLDELKLETGAKLGMFTVGLIVYDYTKLSKNAWTKEWTIGPTAKITVSPIESLKLDYKTFIEYRMFEKMESKWRNRNYFTISYGLKLDNITVEPYIQEEFRVDLSKTVGISFNEIYVGVDLKGLLPSTSLSLAYSIQTTKDNNWQLLQAISGTIKFGW